MLDTWLLAVVPVLLTLSAGLIAWIAKRIIERLDALDAKVDAQKVDVALVKKEVLPNGGTSMRDAIHRVETDVAVLKAQRV